MRSTHEGVPGAYDLTSAMLPLLLHPLEPPVAGTAGFPNVRSRPPYPTARARSSLLEADAPGIATRRSRRGGGHPSAEVQVGGEAVPAALPAEARLPVAAERRRRVETVERVGPDHAGPQAAGELEDAAALVGPHPRRQAVRGVVGLLDRLVGSAERQHRQHRAEDLLLGDAVGLGDAG